MRCVKDKKGFLVLPETEFEEQVVSSFQNNCECFVKCGVTPAEIIGIAIRHKVNSDQKEAETQPITQVKSSADATAKQIIPCSKYGTCGCKTTEQCKEGGFVCYEKSE